jgi:uncharacterized membrane protein YkoI
MFKKRIYWVVALVALLALTGAAVTATSKFTSAEGPGPATAVASSDQQVGDDDAVEEAKAGPDTDNIEEESGDQNATENGAEAANASTDTVVPCSDPTGADDAVEEANAGPDTDNIEEQCGDQNEADGVDEADDGDVAAPSGTLDDGKDLLPQAGITIDQAITAAQTAASGSVGEIDLEDYQGKLVFNVDVGDKDVKVDASDGSILAADSDD